MGDSGETMGACGSTELPESIAEKCKAGGLTVNKGREEKTLLLGMATALVMRFPPPAHGFNNDLCKLCEENKIKMVLLSQWATGCVPPHLREAGGDTGSSSPASSPRNVHAQERKTLAAAAQ